MLAYREVARGHDERATTLLGGADGIWRTISWRHTVSNQREHDQVQADMRARLGQVRYDRAFEAGLAMNRREVVEYALRGTMPDRRTRAKTAPRPSAVLSPREMEVARLVARWVASLEVGIER